MPSFGKSLDDMLEQLGAEEPTPGNTLRVHRKRFEMTLKELEDVTGIKEANLSSLENGRIEMTPHYAEIFAAAFGLHPTIFLYPKGDFSKTKELALVQKRRPCPSLC